MQRKNLLSSLRNVHISVKLQKKESYRRKKVTEEARACYNMKKKHVHVYNMIRSTCMHQLVTYEKILFFASISLKNVAKEAKKTPREYDSKSLIPEY